MSNHEKELICYVRDYPLITAEQLCRLTDRTMQSVGRSLLKLCNEKPPYINRNKNRESINTKYVYAVTRHAALDKEYGGHPVDLSERKDKGLRHEELITEIHISLKEQVTYWRQDRKHLWKHGVQPDAFFKVQLPDERRRSYFLEAETGTNNPVDVYRKYRGYERLRDLMKREQLDWLPMVKFSVLTILPTPDAARALEKELYKSEVIDEKYKGFYTFTTLSELLIN